tara:strand:- start:1054 stop:1818 length:765 start_codon:yes stop_codon:yes gene_type:complete
MAICVVFVCNKKYLPKFTDTINMLKTAGKYKGDITLIIGADLKDQKTDLETKYNIEVVYFPEFTFDEDFMNSFYSLTRPGIWKNKIFQYHKFHLFNSYFKKWDYILYLDCGIKILRPIQPLLDLQKANILLARNDPWGPFINKWSLGTQFDETHPKFNELNSKYNLFNIKNYFNTSCMLFDTNIIQENTCKNLYDLSIKYPLAITNDQAIVALYFICIDEKWEELSVEDDEQYFYDYKPRNRKKPYIMHKWWEL